MKRKQRRFLLAGVAIVALLIFGGYWYLSGGRRYSTDLNNLRAQFNHDKGKVRLVLLLSPT